MKYDDAEILGKHVQQVEADNAELRAEIERLRPDAERWQWLKENDQLFLIALRSPVHWDKAIDAAREGEK